MTPLPADIKQMEARLNAPTREERLAAARALAATQVPPVQPTVEVNNHVHTIFSFSPHSPAAAAWHARRAGLQAVGIMDHDSVAGIEEMLEAGAIFGIATTAGFEVRVNFSDTPFASRVINGPGLTGIAYIAVHGIPATQIARCDAFLQPIRAARNERNARMVEKLNSLLAAQKLPPIDFQRDVYDQSEAKNGGSITERHILAALARMFIEQFGMGAPLLAFLESTLKIEISERLREYLCDAENPHYLYDLLGILKAHYADEFFIHPDYTECVNVREVIALAEEIGAISAYAYLGDVSESPTGDKKAEKFEDDFLDELVACLRELRFRAITYMPPRNTAAQLARIGALCEKNGLMQISGVDINSSRQSFNCPELLDPCFAKLITATWALIGHEKVSSKLPGCGLFGHVTCDRFWTLQERLTYFSQIGPLLDPHAPTEFPDSVIALLRQLQVCGCGCGGTH